MTWIQKGVAIELMALSWESEEQGTIPADLRTLQKISGIRTETLQNFFRKFPEFFHISPDLKLRVCHKLREQATKYREISEKRKQAASKCSANAQQMGGSAFAVASAFASKGVEAGAAPPDERLNVDFVKARIAPRTGGEHGKEFAADKRRRANQAALDAVS
jgi:hypothetical protein